ncbi:hypothetical protein PCANC_04848 [Puccinia coronata f. sp. avenae]|uniref:Uncharacterized protein n=1 Tax=Puccinia coronata f. sp. avenae TaxID=200324 RepID=A0A2N5W2P5_9BASI|nr:hypothetical protein PCANC_04848 [Puccinia coronata f. sp. avenae]
MKLSGYGSAATGLQEDKMYIVSGRLVVSKHRTTGVLYYDSELNVLISDSKTFTTSLANKTACWGFGIIVSRSEVTEPGETSNVLMVTLRHTDYDNANKVSVDFDVRYRILGHRNLGKVFGLFQVGREVVITGYISGFEDKGSRVWIVTALSFSVASGHKTNLPAANQGDSSGPSKVRCRPDDDKETPTASTSTSQHAGQNNNINKGKGTSTQVGQSETPDDDPDFIPEEGEIAKPNALQGFPDTFPKKRTQKTILADAKKRMKQTGA